MIRPSSRRPRPPRPALAVAVALLSMAALSACGGTDAGANPSSAGSTTPGGSPSPSVAVPSGVQLTEPGTKLRLGQSATVAYRPNEKRGTVLRITVDRLRRGTIGQLSGYVLDRSTRRSTPYYVTVRVQNVGEGDVGRTDVPLWVVDQDNTLIHSSSFTDTYRRCPSRSLPKRFGPGQKADRCLVYLVPHRGRLTGVSFRPMQAVAPIEWHGRVADPVKAGHGQKGEKKS